MRGGVDARDGPVVNFSEKTPSIQPKLQSREDKVSATTTNKHIDIRHRWTSVEIMPWQAAPSLLIIFGAFNVAAGLIWTVDRTYYGKVRCVRVCSLCWTGWVNVLY